MIEAMLRSTAPSVAERVLAGKPTSSARVFHAPPGYLRRAWGDGWALVGDAGYFKDPISAHGMTDAVRDAELLARALYGGGDEARTLAEYQRQRDALALPLLNIVDRIASHQWSSAEISSLLKQLAACMRDEHAVLLGLEAADARPRAA